MNIPAHLPFYENPYFWILFVVFGIYAGMILGSNMDDFDDF